MTDRAFAPLDWALVAGVASTWGASFLFIDIALDHFAPGLVAFGRVLFGAVTLTAVPRARAPVARSEWPQIALLGVLWMAVPFMLFSVAQQWIDSSLAGMINAAAPLFTAVVAGVVVRQLPGRIQAIGLALGFAGVLAISWPSLGEGESTGLGVGLVLLATVLYGCAFNLAAPLQRRNGALPVIWRAQLVSLACCCRWRRRASRARTSSCRRCWPWWRSARSGRRLRTSCSRRWSAAWGPRVGR